MREPGHGLGAREAAAYQQLYAEAWSELERIMAAGTSGPSSKAPNVTLIAGCVAARFSECLKIVPDAWPCMWGIGKAFQAQGQHRQALAWFERAMRITRENPDVFREASLAALSVGEPSLAGRYAAEALALKPDDAGLHANQALALSAAGNDAAAVASARRACELDPRDASNRAVMALVREVQRGARPRRDIADICGSQ